MYSIGLVEEENPMASSFGSRHSLEVIVILNSIRTHDDVTLYFSDRHYLFCYAMDILFHRFNRSIRYELRNLHQNI